MKPSPQLVQFLKRRESENGVPRLEAYRPTPTDVWTNGYGHTNNAYKGQIITPQQAELFLMEDIEDACDSVDTTVTRRLTQSEYDALVSLLFNIPFREWKRSKARAALNSGDIMTFVEEAFSRTKGWTKDNGHILDGLVNRRAMERDIFLHGVYAS